MQTSHKSHQIVQDWLKHSGKCSKACSYKRLQYLPERKKHRLAISWTPDRHSCCWVLQKHYILWNIYSLLLCRSAMKQSVDVTLNQYYSEGKPCEHLIWHHKEESKEIISSLAPVYDSLQLETAQRHICTSISRLKDKARWGSSKSFVADFLVPLRVRYDISLPNGTDH